MKTTELNEEIEYLLKAISEWEHDYSSTLHKMRAKKLLSELKALESSPDELEIIIRDAYRRGYEDRDFDIGYGSNIPYLLETYLKPIKH